MRNKLDMKYKLLIAIIFICQSLFAQITPKKLLIYYNWPSALGTNTQAANILKEYDYVVLGENIELENHGAHINTVEILEQPVMANVNVYGYVYIGEYINEQVNKPLLPIQEIKDRIFAWSQMGNNVKGVLLDLFEYGYKVPRQRQNEIVNYAHGLGLKIIANGWLPDDIFGSFYHPLNSPTQEQTALDSRDFYLSESYLIKDGQFQDSNEWFVKAEKLQTYQQNIGFEIMSITTPGVTTYSDLLFHYAWYGALLYNHIATGWGEIYYGATQGYAINHPRPILNTGTDFTSSVQVANAKYSRLTNGGEIFIDTSSNTYGFIPSTSTCISISTNGYWNNSLTWSCNRIPNSTDDVIIKNGHKVENLGSASCKSLTVEAGAVFTGNPVFQSKP